MISLTGITVIPMKFILFNHFIQNIFYFHIFPVNLNKYFRFESVLSLFYFYHEQILSYSNSDIITFHEKHILYYLLVQNIHYVHIISTKQNITKI